jgi:hypothetical protein
MRRACVAMQHRRKGVWEQRKETRSLWTTSKGNRRTTGGKRERERKRQTHQEQHKQKEYSKGDVKHGALILRITVSCTILRFAPVRPLDSLSQIARPSTIIPCFSTISPHVSFFLFFCPFSNDFFTPKVIFRFRPTHPSHATRFQGHFLPPTAPEKSKKTFGREIPSETDFY